MGVRNEIAAAAYGILLVLVGGFDLMLFRPWFGLQFIIVIAMLSAYFLIGIFIYAKLRSKQKFCIRCVLCGTSIMALGAGLFAGLYVL